MELGNFRRLTKGLPDKYEILVSSTREWEQDIVTSVVVSKQNKDIVLCEIYEDNFTSYKVLEETNKPRNIDKVSSDIKLIIEDLLTVGFNIKDNKGFNSDYYQDTLNKINDISLDLKGLQSVFTEERVNDIQMNEASD